MLDINNITLTLPEILGWVGCILLIISFLAQLYSIQRTKQVNNISYLFILLQLIVNLMFFTYDLYIMSYPLIIGNGSVAILLVVMSLQKFLFTHYCYNDAENESEFRSLV